MQEVRRPSDLECAFYGGLFDATGSLRVSLNHGRFWQARVAIRHRASAARLREVYGGALAASGWEVKRYGAVACFLQDILPYVIEKHSLIEAVLARFSSRASVGDGAVLVADLARLRRVAVDGACLPQAGSRRCSWDGCTRAACSRGLCGRHYQQARLSGTLAVRRRRAARSFSYRRVPTQRELAYAGGFFDGCGSVRFVATRPQVAFARSHGGSLLHLWSIYGGSLSLRRNVERQQLIWRLTAREASIAFLRDVLPFVVEKREEVARVLAEFSPSKREEGSAADHPDEGRSDADLGTCT